MQIIVGWLIDNYEHVATKPLKWRESSKEGMKSVNIKFYIILKETFNEKPHSMYIAVELTGNYKNVVLNPFKIGNNSWGKN